MLCCVQECPTRAGMSLLLLELDLGRMHLLLLLPMTGAQPQLQVVLQVSVYSCSNSMYCCCPPPPLPPLVSTALELRTVLSLHVAFCFACVTFPLHGQVIIGDLLHCQVAFVTTGVSAHLL